MKLSAALAELNYERFQKLSLDTRSTPDSKQAALAFNGDTYAGLKAWELSPTQLEYAQLHLRILSGLYGLLRPLDRIQPYRLEMGTRLPTQRGKNLYEFWGPLIAKELNKSAARAGASVLVNLASQEYFGAVDQQVLKVPVLACSFQEVKNGKASVVGFCAKRARGMMARFIIERHPTELAELKAFNAAGYRFVPSASSEWEYVFRRQATSGQQAGA
jgi:cytoplasmic iron level regulating protein YaaA (DUF328/UPF0246 family)